MKSSPRRPSRNQLRIIGGKWRGRKLDFPSVEGLRPTGDRIRETLFNWLAPTLPGAHCLDLFAGSGALGLEALSREAERAVLLDSDPRVIASLREQVRRLEASNVTVIQADALPWLTMNDGEGTFDLVFLDPPFQANLLDRLAEVLNSSTRLRAGALIYLECDRDQRFLAPHNWTLLKQKAAGQVSYSLYRCEALGGRSGA